MSTRLPLIKLQSPADPKNSSRHFHGGILETLLKDMSLWESGGVEIAMAVDTEIIAGVGNFDGIDVHELSVHF